MTRFISLIFITALLFCHSCSSQQDPSALSSGHAHPRPQVLATTGMIADLVSIIGGNEIDVKVLIPPALDPHSYELVKGDDEKFSAATIIFYNGLGLEHGLSVKRHILKHGERAICVTQLLQKEEPSALLKANGVYDPHVWMDISLWSKALDPICDALSKEWPSYQEQFVARKENLRQKMEEADRLTYEKIQSLPCDKRYLVTSHDAFHYFVRRYFREGEEKDWSKRCNAPEGLAPEAELSTVDLLKVFNYMQEHKVTVLFTESNVPTQGIYKLFDTGAKKGLSLRLAKEPLYADSMGEAPSYLGMILHNVEVIVGELSL